MNGKSSWIFFLCLPSLWGAIARSDDWSSWRGERGDGLSREDRAPLRWSSTENVRWRLDIPGLGRSSPIVKGDSVYVTTFLPGTLDRRLVKIDSRTGEIQWSTSVHQGEVENQHKFNTSASATPTCDGKKVYTVFVDSKCMIVAAIGLDGAICWKKQIGTFFSKHGFAASPILCDQGLIVNGHQDGDAFVMLLDTDSGESVWTYRPKASIRSFSTPIQADINGQKQIILSGSNETLGLDPKTGNRIWFAEGPTEKVVSTPSFGHGCVFTFGGSPDTKAFALCVDKDGEIPSTRTVWERSRGMPYVPSPLLYGNFLHVVDDMGIYTCIEPATGRVLKTLRKGGNTYSSPIGVAGRVYMFDDSGTCTVISNDGDFQVLAKNEMNELVQTTPAISNGRLYVRSETKLWCIEE